MVIEGYPFKGNYLNLSAGKLHYLDEGSGHPVLMLHGNPTWSFYYRNLILSLRDGYRTIVPDHMGCGLSDRPSADEYDYTLKSRVTDVKALLDHLNISGPVTLVLHDWGGMIGMALAHLNPGLVGRLVILNTGAFHLPASKPLPWQLSLVKYTPFGEILVRGLNAFCLGAVKTGTMKPLSPEAKKGLLLPYDSWKNRIAVYRFVKGIPIKPGEPDYDLVSEVEEGLGQFRNVPKIIFWGMKDFVFDIHFLNRWKEVFPDAPVHEYKNGGHYIMEDEKDEIIRLTGEFLAENPPVAPERSIH